MNNLGPADKRQVEALLEEMTLREKIGQMTQVARSHITPEEVAEHAIGSVLNGGSDNPEPNTPAAWAAMARAYEEAALESRPGVPLLYGVDAVHGHSNVRGATVFPHNVGLGATGNPNLVEVIGRITAAEMLATNIHWNFAPCVAVPQDVRWGRTYEGFGSDPEQVAAMSAAYVCGLQLGNGRAALACAKHFVGDGGTRWGSRENPEWLDWWDWGETWQIDQGVTDVDEATLRAIHVRPYVSAGLVQQLGRQEDARPSLSAHRLAQREDGLRRVPRLGLDGHRPDRPGLHDVRGAGDQRGAGHGDGAL